MHKSITFKEDLHILVTVILLLFSETPMKWITQNDILLPTVIQNPRIIIPLKNYPQSATQLYNIIATVRFIYNALAVFLFGMIDYNSVEWIENKFIYLEMSSSYLFIRLVLPNFDITHIDNIKAAACSTILTPIQSNKLTPQQNIFTTHLASLNTIHLICRNKADYCLESIYSCISPTTNILRSTLPILSQLLCLSKYITAVKLHHESNLIIYYPMKLNIMTNNNIIANHVRSYYISLSHYIPVTMFCYRLEKYITYYQRHCNDIMLSIYEPNIINMINNTIINSNSVFT